MRSERVEVEAYVEPEIRGDAAHRLKRRSAGNETDVARFVGKRRQRRAARAFAGEEQLPRDDRERRREPGDQRFAPASREEERGNGPGEQRERLRPDEHRRRDQQSQNKRVARRPLVRLGADAKRHEHDESPEKRVPGFANWQTVILNCRVEKERADGEREGDDRREPQTRSREIPDDRSGARGREQRENSGRDVDCVERAEDRPQERVQHRKPRGILHLKRRPRQIDRVIASALGDRAPDG